MASKLDEGQFYIGIMFRAKMEGSMSDYLISKITGGKWDHVDTLFVPARTSTMVAEHQLVPRRQTMRQLFSTFVREYYRGYVPMAWETRREGEHLLMLLPVTERQYDRAREYVSELCRRETPYNYLDLTLCAMPSKVASFVGPDTKPYPVPRKVFCSQAAVLMLRQALHDNTDVYDALSSVNSRSCSPMELYNLLSSGKRGCDQFKRVMIEPFVKDCDIIEWEQGGMQNSMDTTGMDRGDADDDEGDRSVLFKK